MKVLIVSDTHGRHAGIEEAIQREKPLDLLIHLGDVEGYEDYIQDIAGCPMEIVAGNCDYLSQLPAEKEIMIDDLRVLVTHGHGYYISTGYDYICREGRSRQMDVVMFGHTHRPVILEEKGITVLNPGSIAFPRQSDRRLSYIVMEKEHGAGPKFEIRYLGEKK